MKLTMLFLSLSWAVLSTAQDDSLTQPESSPVTFVLDSSLFPQVIDYPWEIDIIPPPPPIDISQWIIISPSIVWFPIQRMEGNCDHCFGYSESNCLSAEIHAMDDQLISTWESHDNLTIQVSLHQTGKKQKLFSPLFNSPIYLKQGYNCLTTRFKSIIPDNYVISIDVYGESQNIRIQPFSRCDIWNIENSCINKMNLL